VKPAAEVGGFRRTAKPRSDVAPPIPPFRVKPTAGNIDNDGETRDTPES
jgi:hypothetical protein